MNHWVLLVGILTLIWGATAQGVGFAGQHQQSPSFPTQAGQKSALPGGKSDLEEWEGRDLGINEGETQTGIIEQKGFYDPEETFRQGDVNGDGVWSEEEYLGVFQNRQEQDLPYFGWYDLNNDQSWDPEEFVEYYLDTRD